MKIPLLMSDMLSQLLTQRSMDNKQPSQVDWNSAGTMGWE